MKSLLLLTLFFILNSAFVQAQDISCANSIGDCSYYQCVEQQEKCGSKGYYHKFAYHYCVKYKNDTDEYSQLGQIFLNNIRQCLQEELEIEKAKRGKMPSCSNVKSFAVGTHEACYEKYRFCELSYMDKFRIKYTAKKEIFDFDMLKFAFHLEKMCL